MKNLLLIIFLSASLNGFSQMFFHANNGTQVKPSPSVTYATWNPADKSANVTLSGGDLTAAGTTTGAVRATIGKSSGKWYWEITLNTVGWHQLGVGNASASLSSTLGDANSWSMWQDDGNCEHGGSSVGNNGGSSNSDVIGFALDMDAGTLQIYRNNSLLGYAFSGITGTMYPMYDNGGNAANVTANFGATSLTYTPPSGYNAGLYN